jgi:arsenate reductase
MSDAVLNVLFVCTGNSARSVLGEALLNHVGRRAFRAFSAGSHPAGNVHPLALAVLADKGVPTTHLRSKSWDEFAAPGALPLDFVIVVCANAAAEYCPQWPGDPVTAYWCLDDPAAASGSEAQRRTAFERTYAELVPRIRAFVDLPIRSLDRRALCARLDSIGEAGAVGADAA